MWLFTTKNSLVWIRDYISHISSSWWRGCYSMTSDHEVFHVLFDCLIIYVCFLSNSILWYHDKNWLLPNVYSFIKINSYKNLNVHKSISFPTCCIPWSWLGIMLNMALWLVAKLNQVIQQHPCPHRSLNNPLTESLLMSPQSPRGLIHHAHIGKSPHLSSSSPLHYTRGHFSLAVLIYALLISTEAAPIACSVVHDQDTEVSCYETLQMSFS